MNAIPASSTAELDLWPALAVFRRRIALIGVCVVLGAGAGFFAAGPSSQVFEARTVIFVGARSGLSKPLTLTALAHATGLLAPIARRARLPLAELETSIAAGPLGGVQSTTSAAPATRFFEIRIRGAREESVLLASRLVASALISKLARYQSAEIADDAERLQSFEQARATLAQRINQQARLVHPGQGVVELGALGILQDTEHQITIEVTVLRLRLAQLTQANKSEIVSSGARLASARTRLYSTLVAAAIGLLLGLVAALTLPPLSRARPRR
jgi:hypothetical protein